jgi:hypothetical protein
MVELVVVASNAQLIGRYLAIEINEITLPKLLRLPY